LLFEAFSTQSPCPASENWRAALGAGVSNSGLFSAAFLNACVKHSTLGQRYFYLVSFGQSRFCH
jgi:hypothetical protein